MWLLSIILLLTSPILAQEAHSITKKGYSHNTVSFIINKDVRCKIRFKQPEKSLGPKLFFNPKITINDIPYRWNEVVVRKGSTIKLWYQGYYEITVYNITELSL